MKKVIGLTGSFGSGCTTTANHLAKNGYNKISISNDILSILAQKLKVTFTTRKEKQLFGNVVRKKYIDVYKTMLLEKIDKSGENVVIECLRNPIEIRLLRDTFPHFYLFAILANKEKRKQREERKQRKEESDFEDCDKRDEGEKDDLGQQVRRCVNQADIVLDNSSDSGPADDAIPFFSRVAKHIELLDTPFRPPTPEETNMHLAYSLSLHSLCIQRQVGAVITDNKHRVLSAGYNDVPQNTEPCIEFYNGCYRKIKDKKNVRDICNVIYYCPFCGQDLNFKGDLLSKDPNTIEDDAFLCNSCAGDLLDLFEARNLDYCRSLHAEENAILSNPYLADKHREDMNMIIFTTSFPCMLCAKKIANSGIKQLVFVEPYPVKEAHKILKENGVEINSFEGVKSYSFNRIFGKRGDYLKDFPLKRRYNL